MLAGILLLLVIVELAVSVWCLTRFGGVLRELRMCEKQFESLSEMIRNWRPDEPVFTAGGASVELPTVTPDDAVASAGDVLANASDEQLAAAAAILDKLGVGKDA